MIELPEAAALAAQINGTLKGKRILRAVANQSPHKFAWHTGDPAEYSDRLAGKVIGEAVGVGGNVETHAGDMVLSVSAPIRYHAQGEKRPKKHQLLVEFEDGTAIHSTAQMWGGFFCFPADGKGGFPDYDIAKERLSPLSEAFDRAYFDTLFDAETPKLSAKVFLHDPLVCVIALGWNEGVGIREIPLRSEIEDGWLCQRVDDSGNLARVVTRVAGGRFSEF